MSDDEDDDYYGDDDDDGEVERIDLGSFLGLEDRGSDELEDEEDLDEEELDEDEIKENAAIRRIRESVNREEAREVFESTIAGGDDYTEEALDAFITQEVYRAYDDGEQAIYWEGRS